jgi:hypothetical protein
MEVSKSQAEFKIVQNQTTQTSTEILFLLLARVQSPKLVMLDISDIVSSLPFRIDFL